MILLPTDDACTERAVIAKFVARSAHALGHIEHDGDGEDIVVSRELHQAGARCGLNVGRVDHGQQPGVEPLARDEPQSLKCFIRCGLIVLVV